ncbi:glucokinase [Sediminihabitans luteus]|uniref:Glucokinase n=1 Tax=Sediminihabitans luteus TaxID=1138585 RepID=A0A2M9CEW1_9CELL|nr:ROK family protein [Sediminihabitans luteus]PJJ70433.1 glucokinase [Sediminihabitans luteus]GII97906.1 glucokinase [Sediminihabitans luteus]
MTWDTGVGAVAIDIGGTKVDLALVDASGEMLERRRLDTRAADGPEQAVERIARVVRELRAAAAAVDLEVGAHAVVSPGVVQDGRVLLVPTMPGWDRVPLGAVLGEALDVPPIAVWNDVHAAALAEARSGSLVGADPGIYVNLGTGLSSALVVGGDVVRGAHRAAGEIGYLVPGDSATTPLGTAPLEDVVGGGPMARRISALVGVEADAATIFASDDPVVGSLVQHAVAVLATAVANLSTFADPAVVAIGGGMAAAVPTILPVVDAEVRRRVPFPPAVRLAHHVRDASLHGAVALALDELARHRLAEPARQG